MHDKHEGSTLSDSNTARHTVHTASVLRGTSVQPHLLQVVSIDMVRALIVTTFMVYACVSACPLQESQ